MELPDNLTPVPHTELSDDALRGVIESFVLQEGTEYGEHDVSLDAKVKQVVRQLEDGSALIVFDQRTQSVDIRRKDDFLKSRSPNRKDQVR